ncbi:hypothetical protein VHEMI08800 [[Torrubiella] hemipterigena]|uniref:DUF4037 domain-containing protein n=1 Tax=[Torrubiella] hemipterigena TaxID=1531966 RepID=A0A0A1T7Z4_9HYPO|nr:hypothetical protein VHEMI08800 [[Torrubiella] hemipterigena]
MSPPEFRPALELCGDFFRQVVKPILDNELPALKYGAALIGPGSEVYGFDTEMSMDHDWGLRVFLFLTDEDASQGDAITELLGNKLPTTWEGFPGAIETLTTTSTVRQMEDDKATRPLKHHVTPITLGKFCLAQLAYDFTARPPTAAEWLSIPSHALREMVCGAVYHDATGQIALLRRTLAWYPRDVYLYMLAAGCQRIGQESHLMPRAGYAGSELGSAIIASRLVRDIMNLCFLLEKQYAPYAKWFGAGFSRLECGSELEPLLLTAQTAATWQARQDALVQCYDVVTKILVKELGLEGKVPATSVPFHDRPWLIMPSEQLVEAIVQLIQDPDVLRIAERTMVGSIIQWTDNTDMENMAKDGILRLYEA